MVDIDTRSVESRRVNQQARPVGIVDARQLDKYKQFRLPCQLERDIALPVPGDYADTAGDADLPDQLVARRLVFGKGRCLETGAEQDDDNPPAGRHDSNW